MRGLSAAIICLILINTWILFTGPLPLSSGPALADGSYCYNFHSFLFKYHFSQHSPAQTTFSLSSPLGETSFELARSKNQEQLFLQYPITNDDHYIADYYSPLKALMIEPNFQIKKFRLHHWIFDREDCARGQYE